MENSTKIIPFLNWAGGKRWLVNNHSSIFPSDYNTYIEPFLGSGSVYFHLQPSSAILADLNENLIYTYIAVAEQWMKVEKSLKEHHRKHCKEYYYHVRAARFKKSHTRAAQFIYLNRTCWNGLYRVNLNGEFNVPKGTKENVILKTDNFQRISTLLSHAELLAENYNNTIRMAKRNDLIFADPPYTVKHDKNGFLKYNESIFSWSDQIRLRDELIKAKKRGVKIVATNANHSSIIDLYKNDFELKPVSRNSVISGNISGRGKCNEVLIWNS